MWRRLYTVNVRSRSLVRSTEKVYKACSSWRPSKGSVSHDVQCMMLSWCWRIKFGMSLRQTKIRMSRCCSCRGTSCHDSRNALPRMDGWCCHMGIWRSWESSRDRERSRKARWCRACWAMMAEHQKPIEIKSKNSRQKQKTTNKQEPTK